MKQLLWLGVLFVSLQGAGQHTSTLVGPYIDRIWISSESPVKTEDAVWKEDDIFDNGWLVKRTVYIKDWLYRLVELNSTKDTVTCSQYHNNGQISEISVMVISECTISYHCCRPFKGVDELLLDHRIRRVVYDEEGIEREELREPKAK